MTQPLTFPEHPTNPVTERRVDNLERLSLTRPQTTTPLAESNGVFRVLWSVDGPLSAGQSNLFPFFDGDESTLALAWARIAGTSTGASSVEFRRNGVAVATLTIAAGTDVEELALIAEPFATGDGLTIAITAPGTDAADLLAIARFQ